MRYYCIVFVLTVCHVVLSQRFIEDGNFRGRKRGNSGRFRGRFLFRPGQRRDWKMDYNNLDRRSYVTRDHIPWQPHKPEQVTRPVTPGNLAITSEVGYHTRIYADVGRAHMSFYIVLPALRTEANLVELTFHLVSEEQFIRDQRGEQKRMDGRLHLYEQGTRTASKLLSECGKIYGPSND